MTMTFTIESPGAPDVPGEGKPRRNAQLGDQPLLKAPQGMNSLHDLFLRGVELAQGGDYLGYRPIRDDGTAGPYVWETYDQVLVRVKNLSSGLVLLGLEPQAPLGIFSINRPEWVITEQAAFMYNLITVPLYDTLGREAIEHIINQTEMKVVVASKDKVKLLLSMRDTIPSVKHIVVMDGVGDALEEAAKDTGVELLALTELEKRGQAAPATPVLPGPNDVFTICYTSGTTGLPKGVVLTHANMLAEAETLDWLGGQGQCFRPTKDDVHFSYLPLAHVFERVAQVLMVGKGAKIGFYQGDTLKLLDDVAELQPTLFISVPRLFNRIYDKVWSGVKAKGGVAASLFNMAYKQKKANLAKGINQHWLWDKVVFGAVRARLGGRVKYMVTGSAPIAPDVIDFLRICFSVEVYEGYGQTETTGGLSITLKKDLESGNVGVPLPCGEVKLLDVPSMNYTSADKPCPRGEVCIKGNQVFRGYYKDPEKTAETLSSDGWCRTGDVGMWDEKGRLVIFDRVKNIFKLAQGEYIAPERIESVYCKHELVAQAFVYGDSLQATLVGIIVPDQEELLKYAKLKGLDGDFAKLCESDELRKYFLQQLVSHGKANDLKGFENVKNVWLETRAFSVENNMLTPTFKLKRHEAKLHYEDIIKKLYSESLSSS